MVTVTNTSRGERSFHDKAGKVVVLKSGQAWTGDINSGTDKLLKRMSGHFEVSGSGSVDRRRAVQDGGGASSNSDAQRAKYHTIAQQGAEGQIAYDALLQESHEMLGEDWSNTFKTPRPKKEDLIKLFQNA